MGNIKIFEHPLIQHKVTYLRKTSTGSRDFRELVSEIAMLMSYEATKDLPLEDIEIETPMEKTTGKVISGKTLATVPILRAGLGMVDGILNILPTAKVGHIGLYRDEKTHKPVEYYCKLPQDISSREIIVLDPMLATGGSAVEAIKMLKDKGCKHIKFMCIIAAPEGLEVLKTAHEDIDIYIASLDRQLNENAYILPGLGDAGDRLFGTK